MTVISIKQWKDEKEVQEKERLVESCRKCLNEAIRREEKRMTGKYSVILENRAGMLMRQEFNGLPPKRWRIAIPAKVAKPFLTEPDQFSRPETIEFELMKVKNNILYYKEI